MSKALCPPLLILVLPRNHVYPSDVYTLKNAAFATAGKDGKTLKDILDSATTPKVFFDVCNDWDALFAHFRIALQSIQDIQFMKNASCSGHTSGKGFLDSLASCIYMSASRTFLPSSLNASRRFAGAAFSRLFWYQIEVQSCA